MTECQTIPFRHPARPVATATRNPGLLPKPSATRPADNLSPILVLDRIANAVAFPRSIKFRLSLQVS
jgi:hypothetical protein